MQMHRVKNESDWAGIPVSRRNSWQRLAARTGSVLTPGNVLTITGFGLAVAGFIAAGREHYGLGLSLVIVGRLCDLLDGYVADKTGTKSHLGEQLDAGFDKLLVVIAIFCLFIYGLLPVWILAGLLIPHLLIAAISAYRLSRGQTVHPSRAGKYSMAVLWVSLFGFVASNIPGSDGVIDAFFFGALVIGAVSVMMALYAAGSYALGKG